MPITAELHDGRTLEFPDGTDPAIVQATVKKTLGIASVAPTPAIQPTSGEDQLKGFLLKSMASGPGGLLRMGGEQALSNINEAVTKGARTAGDFITRGASTLGASPELAAGLGTAAHVGVEAVPMMLAGGPAKAAAPAFRNTAEWMMRKALKPGIPATLSGKADSAVTTLLDEGVNVTRGGAEVLRAKADEAAGKVADLLKGSTGTVSKDAVADSLLPVYEKYLKQTNPEKSLQAISEEAKAFRNHIALNGSDAIPVTVAQELKQGNYRVLGDKAYGAGLKPDAERDSLKALARGLKEGIEQIHPEVGPLNALQGSLINAAKLVERRSATEGGKNVVGLGAIAPTEAGFWAFLLDRSGIGKSVLARMLNAGQEQIPATIARGALAGYTGAQPQK